MMSNLHCFKPLDERQIQPVSPDGAMGIKAGVCARPVRQAILAGILAILALGAARPPQTTIKQPPTPPDLDTPQTPLNADSEATISLSPKQKRELLKSNFEKMKQDADELAALAKSLQQDIHRSNEDVFSLQVVDKTEKIEKLAKKIRTSAKGS